MKQAKTTAIILAAGISNRMRSYEPRSLLKIKDSTVAETQIKILKEHFDNVILVAGYKVGKVSKRVEKLGAKVVVNEDFLNTGGFESLALALENDSSDGVFVVHGDIVFNAEAFDVHHATSCIIMDTNCHIHDREVGAIMHDGIVTTLSYGLPDKWAQMVYFTGRELKLLKDLAHNKILRKRFRNKLLFEGINHIIESHGEFNYYYPYNLQLLEIDTIGDLKNENIDL